MLRARSVLAAYCMLGAVRADSAQRRDRVRSKSGRHGQGCKVGPSVARVEDARPDTPVHPTAPGRALARASRSVCYGSRVPRVSGKR